VRIELLVTQRCANAGPTRDLVADRLRLLAPDARLEVIEIADPDQASRYGHLGSPTVRIDGHDLEGRSGAVAPGT
jgi:hypothetical protein